MNFLRRVLPGLALLLVLLASCVSPAWCDTIQFLGGATFSNPTVAFAAQTITDPGFAEPSSGIGGITNPAPLVPINQVVWAGQSHAISQGTISLNTDRQGDLQQIPGADVFPLGGNSPFPPLNSYLSITGGVPDFGIASGTTLFTATFLDSPAPLLTWFYGTQTATFAGSLDPSSILIAPSLLAGLGAPGSGLSGNVAQDLYNTQLPIQVLYMDVRDTSVTISTPVPEPGSVLLLGTGLLSVLAKRRRRRSAAA